MRAEPIGQHRDIEAGQVVPQLAVAEEVVDMHFDAAAGSGTPQLLGQLRVVARAGGIEHVAMPVDLEHSARNATDRAHQGGQDAERVHALSQALHVQPDPELS